MHNLQFGPRPASPPIAQATAAQPLDNARVVVAIGDSLVIDHCVEEAATRSRRSHRLRGCWVMEPDGRLIQRWQPALEHHQQPAALKERR